MDTEVVQRDAAIYVRQSHGKERSLAEQEAEGRRDCEASSWPVREVYADLTSASRFARKDRPDWARLIADTEHRRFGVLWMWESSRGDRDAETWLGLLRRCRENDILIRVGTHGHTYDMRKARDWRSLAEDGIDNAYESEKTSLRIQRAMKANAVRGRPHGVTLYGYERLYDPKTRALDGQCPHPVHAPIVREVFRRVSMGDPISRIAADLNQRGIAAPRGGQWTRATVRQLVTNIGYLGKRAAGTRDKPAQEVFDAIWEPLVDEMTYWSVQRRLSDPARKATRPGRYLWLLSYIARCGQCGAHLSVFRAGAYYGCSEGGCVYILREPLDAYVTGWVLRLIQEPGVLGLLSAADDAEVARARAEVDELQARLDAHALMSARGQISDRALRIVTAELEPLIRDAQARAAAATLPPAFRRLAAARKQVREIWDDMATAGKREIIATACTITVDRSLRKVPRGGFDPDRVDIQLRED